MLKANLISLTVFAVLVQSAASAAPIAGIRAPSLTNQKIALCAGEGFKSNSFTLLKTIVSGELHATYVVNKADDSTQETAFECVKGKKKSKTLYTCLEKRHGEGILVGTVYSSDEGLAVSLSRKNIAGQSHEVDRLSCDLM